MEGMVAGPLAGFLFLVAASLPFFVDPGTYAASAVLIGLVAGVYRASPRPRAPPADQAGHRTWTIRVGLLVEAGMHLTLATSRSAYVVGFMLFAFGVHGALWSIVANSLQQRLTPPGMLGRVGSTTLFITAGGNCAGALLGGVIAARFGLTTPYWAGFVVAVIVSAATWRVFDRATVARAYAEPQQV